MQSKLYMRSIRMKSRLWALGLTAAALSGCEYQLPTVTGENSFPDDRVPVTIEISVPADEFLVEDTVYEGFSGTLNYLLVANRFESALTAHGLVRFNGFPDSVTFNVAGASRREAVVNYGAGRVVARVDSTASRPRSQMALQLLPILQDWDTTAVSWQNAVNRPGAIVPWTTPGGTVGPVASSGNWVPGDTVLKDSVVWQLDSLTVGRLARGEIKGLLVRPAEGGSRLELSRLSMSFTVRPVGRPDTAVAFAVSGGPQTFILTPDPPTAARTLRVGGLTGARSVLRLDLSQRVSTCPPGQTGTQCETLPLSQVTLDDVSLVLDPVAVPSGYRPISAVGLSTRRLLEPELGRSAPLGDVLSGQSVPGDRFQPGSLAPVIIDLTGTTINAVNDGDTTLDLALLSDVGQSHFGTIWFDTTPRLRLLYTVVKRPELP
jgi:hypothetical protein